MRWLTRGAIAFRIVVAGCARRRRCRSVTAAGGIRHPRDVQRAHVSRRTSALSTGKSALTIRLVTDNFLDEYE